MQIKLISITPDAEKQIIYCARVSNPGNQSNPEISNLISYCIKHEHWSIFEQAYMTIEIETSRAIASQILRHRSFTFQEFSTRYAQISVLGGNWFEPIELRKQTSKNRQSSEEELKDEELDSAIAEHLNNSCQLYAKLISKGVAKECARFVLPMATKTRLYMSGSIRSWIHYLLLRTKSETQKEHQEIASAIAYIFAEKLPIIAARIGVRGEG